MSPELSPDRAARFSSFRRLRAFLRSRIASDSACVCARASSSRARFAVVAVSACTSRAIARASALPPDASTADSPEEMVCSDCSSLTVCRATPGARGWSTSSCAAVHCAATALVTATTLRIGVLVPWPWATARAAERLIAGAGSGASVVLTGVASADPATGGVPVLSGGQPWPVGTRHSSGGVAVAALAVRPGLCRPIPAMNALADAATSAACEQEMSPSPPSVDAHASSSECVQPSS